LKRQLSAVRFPGGTQVIFGGPWDGGPVSGLLGRGVLPPGWSSGPALASWPLGARGRAIWLPRAGVKRAGARHLSAAADCGHAVAETVTAGVFETC